MIIPKSVRYVSKKVSIPIIPTHECRYEKFILVEKKMPTQTESIYPSILDILVTFPPQNACIPNLQASIELENKSAEYHYKQPGHDQIPQEPQHLCQKNFENHSREGDG